MTPSQLARKRAKDRESQKAARIRTKEYISRLEHELEEIKNCQHSITIVQELIWRNEALNNEIRRLSGAAEVTTTTLPHWLPEDASYIEGRLLRSDSRQSRSDPLVYYSGRCGHSSTTSGFSIYEVSSNPNPNQYEEYQCVPVGQCYETWVSMTGNLSATRTAAIVPLSFASDYSMTNRNNTTGVTLQYSDRLGATQLVDQADVELGTELTEQCVHINGWGYDNSQGYRRSDSYLPDVPVQLNRAAGIKMHGTQTTCIYPKCYYE